MADSWISRKRRKDDASREDASQQPVQKILAAKRDSKKAVPAPKCRYISLLKNELASLESDEWPLYFKNLEKVHQSLNLVYALCSTRRYIATTFENMKISVEQILKRQLTIDDIIEMKYLLPTSINLTYVDENDLRTNCEFQYDSSNQFDLYDPSFSQHQTHRKYVLLFEYTDGEIVHTKRVRQRNGRTFENMFKLPTWTFEKAKKLISKRNTKFRNAVSRFLTNCFNDGINPIIKIKQESLECAPDKFEMQKDLSTQLSSRFVRPNYDNLKQIIEKLKRCEFYHNQIGPNGHRTFSSKHSQYGLLSTGLSQQLVNALYNSHNIKCFYSHQASAINKIWDGINVIVSSSTSSGKSLVFQVAVIQALENDHKSRMMFIFPTKALAQDQMRSLMKILQYMPTLNDILVDTYDGDTKTEIRHHIRENANIIYTNPDMLHISILPNNKRWSTFLTYLKFVIVDELHVYNGLFGSHMALLMRRLRRICASFGNDQLQFISCSATISSPIEHMGSIFGINDVEMVDNDGSPTGNKDFICWNCPLKDPNDISSGKVDACTESARLMAELIVSNVRTIVFCKVRRMCESLLSAVYGRLQSIGRPELVERIMSYRGGYTVQDRRRIEHKMFEGYLLGIIATNALELGIDIGSLDAVIIVGFPHSVTNFRQQVGRAGRKTSASLAILVGESYPIDQHYMKHPEELFSRPNSALRLDITNPLILEGHLQCASLELPICMETDIQYFGEVIKTLVPERLISSPQGYFHCHPNFLPNPSKFIPVRDIEEEYFAIVDVSEGQYTVIEELEASRAVFTIYNGAIFLLQGRTYLVKEFDFDKRIARVQRVNVDWTTQQRDYTDIDPVEIHLIRKVKGSNCRAFYGDIKVTKIVFGYFKINKKRKILDAIQIDNPPVVLQSKGMWLDIPRIGLEILKMRRLDIAASIHAAEHSILSLMPNFVASVPGEVRTECKAPKKELSKKETSRKRPARLTFYDAKGGIHGSGISNKAFDFIDSLLQQSIQRIEECICLQGCPECIMCEQCSHSNTILSKTGASIILRTLLNWPINSDALPECREERLSFHTETVLPVSAPIKQAPDVKFIDESS